MPEKNCESLGYLKLINNVVLREILCENKAAQRQVTEAIGAELHLRYL